jgi:CheY-like chemotaxis protein
MTSADPLMRRRSPCKVLVADDHDETRATQRLILEHFGFAVIEARTGLEALALAQANHPRVVLLDIELPEIDGRELTRMFRADPAMRDAALVAVSALGEPEARASALLAGVDAFLTKPVSPLDLVDLVRSYARRPSPRAVSSVGL